jgi:trehalose-phosphatase
MSKPLNNIDDFEEFGHEVLGRRLSFFLDFDGTLSPIAPSPAQAELPQETRELLGRLSRSYPVAIVTGRALADIKEKVGVAGITYGANHGMEIRSAAFEMDYDMGGERRAELKQAALVLRGIEARYDGLVMEDKVSTLSLHYRLLANELEQEFIKELDGLLSPFKERGLVRVTGGKKVIEVRPNVEWNKGRCVEWILGREGFASTYPVYIGDDETDRDGFRAVRAIGASVYVGEQGSEATYHMEQGAVAAFLKWLVEYKDC